MSDAIESLEDEASDLEQKWRNLLRDRGWSYTCSGPACLWLWEKAMPDGRTLLVDESTAMAIERFNEEMTREAEEFHENAEEPGQ